MFKKLKKIKPRLLLIHQLITLGYPAVRAYVSPVNRLQIFTDAMTFIALMLLIGGVVYALALHGDFDISSFVFKRGTRREDKQSFQAFKEDLEQKRQEAFNYPLFLGIVYLIVAALIAYLIL